MSQPPRNPKRARQKERTNARREASRAYMKRRKRQRRGVLLGTLSALLIAGLTIFIIVRPEDGADPQASPSAAAEPTAPPEGEAAVQDKVACGAEVPDTAGATKEQYDEPEDQKLDPDTTYIWKLETSCGDMEITLDQELSPNTANSIVFLTRQKFYDGTFFHRYAPGQVIQGGDPTGTGSGGAGYDVQDDVPADTSYADGVVGMAKSGAAPSGTSGSQFFIGGPDAAYPADYAVAGKVTAGEDVLEEIMGTATADFQPPQDDEYTYIERATIVER